MEKINPKEYRSDLSNEIKDLRSMGEKGKEKAQSFLEMAKKTPEYQEAKKESVEERKQKTEEKINQLKEQLTGKESKENLPVGKLLSTLMEAQKTFMDKKEFGVEGEKAAEKVSEIIKNVESFITKLQDDYKKEYQYSGIKPDDFMREYGIASLDKDKGGRSWRDVNNYSFDEIKKDHNDNKHQHDRSFGAFKVGLFRKYDWSKDSRKVPLFGEWKKEEIHEEWFNPRQEKFLYKLFTEKENSNSKEFDHWGKPTVIPGINLHMTNEVNTMDKQNPGKKPISGGLKNRYYGWSYRESFLTLEPQVVRQILEEVK